jgi:hypothetical protein
MAATGQKKLLAVDTNFLFDLARAESFARNFKDLFLHPGFQLLVPPTVVVEIVMAGEDDSEEKRALAQEASNNLIGWGIQPFAVNSVGEFIAGRFSEGLRNKGLLPYSSAQKMGFRMRRF